MVENQGCKKCREVFSEDSEERNYSNFALYGFKDESSFRKHNSRNKHCPCKQVNITNEGGTNVGGTNLNETNPIQAIWEPPILTAQLVSEEDYCDDQEVIEMKLKKHNRSGRPLWFETTSIASAEILTAILNTSIQWITLVAEPGSGKTMVAHMLIYMIFKLPYDKSIPSTNITITTGMSDKEWYDQVLENFQLRDGEYLWKEIHKVHENNCIVHRSNFHKRITYLLNNQQYLNNHVLVIDESHFADDKLMTIDKELERLGLTEERMKQYNIKTIFISATPDVNLSLMHRQDNHKLVQLENGPEYKGFKYHYDNGRIIDDNEIAELGQFIRSKFSNPRYHFIRARTQQEKGEYREKISECCVFNQWILEEDDSDNNIYLSFKPDENERKAILDGKRVIKTYSIPITHTFILIKNKYQASKRLKITEYTGIIYEKQSKKRNATVTCNGLIPRFFGYDSLPQFHNNEEPVFICDKTSVEEYIQFSEDFVYEGKDYTGSRIKSDERKTKELKNTCYGNLANITPKTRDKRIYMDGPFDPGYDIQQYLLEDRGFREAGINIQDRCRGELGEGGYMYPKRNIPGHNRNNPGDTFITEDIYKLKFVNNGGGNNINYRPHDGGTGQSFMVYPVYPNSSSGPTDFKYYVHSLIV